MNCIKTVNYRVNDKITSPEVRLIGSDGTQHGVVSIEKAVVIAEDEGLDLVEIAPMAKPPVCKIIDYSKFKYEIVKKAKDAKKKQKVVNVKEIRLRPNIEEHDLEIKINRAKKFLEKGDKVRFNLRFKGRQNAYKGQGVELLDKIAGLLEDSGKIDKNINENKRLYLLEITPVNDNN
ncbi:MAG: translation initiation factor IF-3 [Candidatus Muirbacterium halophilum]|nr:translation initiation factor IF-3 [Candidatus Muirbacterium halophilum]